MIVTLLATVNVLLRVIVCPLRLLAKTMSYPLGALATAQGNVTSLALPEPAAPLGSVTIYSGFDTVPTGTRLPVLVPSTVADASNRVPIGKLANPVRLTVNAVAVAAVTLPVTPLSKVTLSFAAVGSKS